MWIIKCDFLKRLVFWRLFRPYHFISCTTTTQMHVNTRIYDRRLIYEFESPNLEREPWQPGRVDVIARFQPEAESVAREEVGAAGLGKVPGKEKEDFCKKNQHIIPFSYLLLQCSIVKCENNAGFGGFLNKCQQKTVAKQLIMIDNAILSLRK